MGTLDDVVLGHDFKKFLPGFTAIQLIGVVLAALLVFSSLPQLPLIDGLIGACLGVYLMPRIFIKLAKKGLLGKNWDENGLTNNPYL